MITPSFGLTATERVLPKLALDFTTASLDPRVTFTRTGNTATVTNSSGYVVPINADLPRFDYNPVTLVCKGLLIEESRTNLLKQTEDFSTTWSKSGATVSTNTTNAPSGTQIADTLVATTSASQIPNVYLSIGTASATAYTQSVFAKAGTRSWLGISFGSNAITDGAFFDLQNGVVGTVKAGTTATITNYGNGWYRCTATRTLTAATYYSQLEMHSADNQSNWATTTSDTIILWGAQLEAGSFATSYIPTTTSQVTRSADVATMTGTNFSDWFNASEGTLFAQYQTTALASAAVFSIADDIVAPLNYIYLLKAATNTTNRFNITSAGVSQGNNDVGSLAINTTYRLAGGYAANNSGFSVNSSAVVTDASVTLPTGINQAVIGRLFNQYVNGTIAEISYYPLRLTNAEIRSISK